LRIVSLVPSFTETLLDWGITPVACTRFCEQPGLQHVGGTKNPDLAAIGALAPDLVLMDSEENRSEDYDALVASGTEVFTTAVRDLASLNVGMQRLAERLGKTWIPVSEEQCASDLVSCFVPIWRRPWMALGSPTYGTDLLAFAGARNVITDVGPYPEITLDDVKRRGPHVVLAPSEPYPFRDRHVAELSFVAPTRLVEGKDLFWWGSRTLAALERVRILIESIAVDR
jgi:ABC-type Fe3+-hydroxamate transport system substrate-binding protein